MFVLKETTSIKGLSKKYRKYFLENNISLKLLCEMLDYKNNLVVSDSHDDNVALLYLILLRSPSRNERHSQQHFQKNMKLLMKTRDIGINILPPSSLLPFYIFSSFIFYIIID